MISFNFDCTNGQDEYRVTINADSLDAAVEILEKHLIDRMRPDLTYKQIQPTSGIGVVYSDVEDGSSELVEETLSRAQRIIAMYTKKDVAQVTNYNPSDPEWIKNQWGRLIPSPSLEKDDKGRDLDKIHRWCKLGDNLFDESTLDRLNEIEETPTLNAQREERLIAMYEAETPL